MYAARRILKNLKRGEAVVTVADPRSSMTYQPFLPEAAAGPNAETGTGFKQVEEAIGLRNHILGANYLVTISI